jgi:hypothetical protein
MGQEIRNYRITYKDHFDGEHTEVIQAYDLNEALVQFSVAHRGKDHEITEIIPFKYIEEQKPVIEQKKEVHVKPNPVRVK